MKLNLGCGSDLRDGWLNVDLEAKNHPSFKQWDLRNGLPKGLTDIGIIYSSHLLEHLSLQQARQLFIESYQILNSGGVFRISFPDFKAIARAYLDGNLNYFSACYWVEPKTLMGYMNYALYQNGEHVRMWDVGEVCLELSKVGFTARESSFQTDLDPNNQLRRDFSAYVSAVKTP